MSSPMPVALPYGMNDCKIYPYADTQGSVLGTVGYDLPYIQTFSWAEAEEYTDLRGDDSLVATHGNGAQVNWSLEAGGISLTIWSIITGGQIIEAGAAPNRTITLRKLSTDARPYFRVDGSVISDSGGNIKSIVYRAKCNGDISGQFGDGQFFVTSANGVGLPMLGSKLLYDIVQYETRQGLVTSGVTNPIMPPVTLFVTDLADTTLTLNWEEVTGVDGYDVESSTDGTSFTSVTTDETDTFYAVTSLTADTDYWYRVASVIGGVTGDFSSAVAVHTLP